MRLSGEHDMANDGSTNEKACNRKHVSIEEAIQHARTNLGGQDVEPYWGGMGEINPGRVVGYQVTARKRWRLDFDPDPKKGVHVNEENFDAPASQRKVLHRVELVSANDVQVRLYWNKWTSRYGTPGRGAYCRPCLNWHVSGRCPFGTR
jgi:hypothetical protein